MVTASNEVVMPQSSSDFEIVSIPLDKLLGRLPVFEGVDMEAFYKEFSKHLVPEQYLKGDLLFYVPMPQEHVYLVGPREGCISTTYVCPMGSQGLTGLFVRGDIIGLEAMLPNVSLEHEDEAIVRLKGTSVIAIPVSVFKSMMEKHPNFKSNVYQQFSEQGKTLKRDLAYSRNPSYLTLNKICKVLCDLADRLNKRVTSSFLLKVA